MLIEWCIGVHRPHKSLLIWQSHSIAGAARPPLPPSLLFFSFLAGDPSTALLHAGSCRSKGSETAVKRGPFDDRWWMWSSAKLPLYFCILPHTLPFTFLFPYILPADLLRIKFNLLTVDTANIINQQVLSPNRCLIASRVRISFSERNSFATIIRFFITIGLLYIQIRQEPRARTTNRIIMYFAECNHWISLMSKGLN